MDISSLAGFSMDAVSPVAKIGGTEAVGRATGKTTGKTADGSMFDSILNTAIDDLDTADTCLSDAENEKLLFALGETENTHDLTIALQKASTALQYTVAVRDKFLEAYKEIMNMQI